MGFFKTKCLLFLNTRTEHRTNVRFLTQYSFKMLTPPKVEVYTYTDKVLRVHAFYEYLFLIGSPPERSPLRYSFSERSHGV